MVSLRNCLLGLHVDAGDEVLDRLGAHAALRSTPRSGRCRSRHTRSSSTSCLGERPLNVSHTVLRKSISASARARMSS